MLSVSLPLLLFAIRNECAGHASSGRLVRHADAQPEAGMRACMGCMPQLKVRTLKACPGGERCAHIPVCGAVCGWGCAAAQNSLQRIFVLQAGLLPAPSTSVAPPTIEPAAAAAPGGGGGGGGTLPVPSPSPSPSTGLPVPSPSPSTSAGPTPPSEVLFWPPSRVFGGANREYQTMRRFRGVCKCSRVNS